MICRCILPPWAKEEFANRKPILEGNFTDEQLLDLNSQYYNIHYLPNYPSHYESGITIDGSQIDVFEYVFVDMDLKDKIYGSKQEFLSAVKDSACAPSRIIDSGNGVHAYWRVTDLDAMSFLRLQRRLLRLFNTDEAVAKIFQLMRPPGFVNTKHKTEFKMCELVEESGAIYTCEDLDKWLPQIRKDDEDYCKQHYDKTYNIKDESIRVDEKIPLKFNDLIRNSTEAKDIWMGNIEDRSKGDYRLGHLMFAHGFSKEEAMSVLINSAKAVTRAPKHRIAYAQGIIEKIWTFELQDLNLSSTVKEILQKSGDALKGDRFPCHRILDATNHGFRLGQVIGLVAGSGVGKTAMALNMFKWFVEKNPEYDHFFIPLEQPVNEIADRWKTMCGDDDRLHGKVHVISNYADDGSFRHLSLDDIKDYLLKFQKVTGKKIGCVVIDHIGALKKKGRDGENQDIMDICHSMKAFAIQTNTLLVMQSQSSREKAGIGDLELNKDAAYGTVYFESYCDFLVTIWQPLKRCYSEEGCPTVTAFKFCKIRHKKKGLDGIEEDVPYKLLFDPITEHMRELTEDEEKQFNFYNNQATNKRKLDRKTDLVAYKSINWTGVTNGEASSNKDPGSTGRAPAIP